MANARNREHDDTDDATTQSSPRVPTLPVPRAILSQLWLGALDLFFPPRCVSCRRRGSWFCSRCYALIVPIESPLCRRCGQAIASDTLCPRCQIRPPLVTGLRAAAYLEGPLRQAIHSFKYNGVRALAQPLGRILYEKGYAANRMSTDLVLPVPLHPARLGQRGFNQAALLAEELAWQVGVELDCEGLVRVRDTRSQVGLSAAERYANVQGAFAWRGNGLDRKHVLLIDDVCTTGATMEACAEALWPAGAAAVWGLALAREGHQQRLLTT